MKRTWSFGLFGRLFSTGTSNDPADNALEPAVKDDQRLNCPDLAEESQQAVERLARAAETGDPVAQNRFGLTLAVGTGLLVSDEPARKWLSRAARQGYAEAQFNLGNLYQSASLRPSSSERGEARIEAYVWFQLAAAQGHARAAASCEMVNLQLTDVEVAEGNRRANGFECIMEAPVHGTHPGS